MKQSQLFGGTRREIPKDETSKNAILLMRGGYINKTMAGVYSYLPLGFRVLQKVTAIVRDEMNSLRIAQEILMPALQPRELWQETGRWDEAVADVLYTLEESTLALGPTHEEIVTDLFRQYVSSYKDLPLAVYQIQNKFRKELRAKSGLLRGREFLMKDMYSFHTTPESLSEFYELTKPKYLSVYSRCGLNAIITEASGGMFSKFSHEFQVICPSGEDTIYLNQSGDYAQNKEIVSSETDQELLDFCGGTLKKESAIEVGNIFSLNQKFTLPMNASVALEDGSEVSAYMGCYGIGISRLIGTMVEVLAEDSKMVWPEEVAPFAVHLLDLTKEGAGEAIYMDLLKKGVDVLFDDREASAGEKFADADLIGSPTRLIVSARSLKAGGIEKIDLRTGESQIVSEY